MLISDLKLGQSATITSIGNDDYLHQLHSMGIITGCDVMLLRYSPLNDLVLLKVSGNFIALNSNQAKYISVEIAK